jgi:hypothetical protein
VSGSGLIYAAVLGAWAVYFVSRSLRSGPRDVVVPNEGVVLRRRGTVDVPPGAYTMIRLPSEASEEPVVKQRRPDAAVERGPAPVRVSQETAVRRRRMLALLALACLATSATTLARITPAWAAMVPVLAVGTYLLELRVQTRRARAPRALVQEPVIEVPKRRPARRADGFESPEFFDPWPAFEEPEVKAGRIPDMVEGWEPRPVPLPTYVTAAKAEPVPARRIDITAGRAWTAATEPVAATATSVVTTESGETADQVAQPEPGVKTDPAAPAATATADPDKPTQTGAAAAAETPIADDLAAEFQHKRAVND